jgi:hypothetical protein
LVSCVDHALRLIIVPLLPDEVGVPDKPGSFAGFTAFFEGIPKMVILRIDLPFSIGRNGAIKFRNHLIGNLGFVVFRFEGPNDGEAR